MSAHKNPNDSAHNAAGGAAGNTAEAPEGAHVETVGAFDIRIFIGSLIGIFGILLVGMGLFAFTEAAAVKTGGINANLWAGLVMIAFAIGFVVWTKLEPLRIVVSDNEEGAETPKDIAPVD